MIFLMVFFVPFPQKSVEKSRYGHQDTLIYKVLEQNDTLKSKNAVRPPPSTSRSSIMIYQDHVPIQRERSLDHVENRYPKLDLKRG